METFFFSQRVIQLFLQKNKHDLEKYDEFLIGLALSRMYYQITGDEDVPIGFGVKSKYFYTNSPESLDIDELKVVIDKMKEDDFPIDIVISFDPIDRIKFKTRNGDAFQIKRFRKNVNGDCTLPLIDYLTKTIPRKYARVNAHLLIFLEQAETVDFQKVSTALAFSEYPFVSIKFMLVQPQDTWLGELWPKSGMNNYSTKELMQV